METALINDSVATDIKVRDTDILSEDDQNFLIQWRDKFREGFFEIGDRANEIIERCAVAGFPFTQDEVHKAVARFCDRSPRTVRYYAETSAFFPSSIRDEYDALPFSHFVLARSLGDRWREVLDYASEHPQATRSELEFVFVFARSQDLDKVREISRDIINDNTEFDSANVSVNSRKYDIIKVADGLIKNINELERYIKSSEYGGSSTTSVLISAFKTIRQTLPSIISRYVV